MGKGEQAAGSANRVLQLQSRAVKEIKSPNNKHRIHSFSHPTSFFPFWSGICFILK